MKDYLIPHQPKQKTSIYKNKRRLPSNNGEKRRNSNTLVVTYHPSNPPLGSITKELHPILFSSERMKAASPSPPLTSYRRPKYLKDLLLHAEVSTSTKLDAKPLAKSSNLIYLISCKRCGTPICG